MTSEQDILNFSKDFETIENQIKTAIVGQENIIRSLIVALIAGGNVLLEGFPGLGKTSLVKTVGQVLDLSFSRIQFTPDLMPSDITGTMIFTKTGDSGVFKFEKGPVFTNLLLADEINRGTPKTQSALLEAMQEKTVTASSNTYELPSPFFVIATQNPLEMEGTYPLPEAQMDRFMLKLNVFFPKKADILNILDLTTGENEVVPEKVFDRNKIIEMNKIARSVPVSTAVREYAAELILKTHPESEYADDVVKKYVKYGSSPRGAQALIQGAKIYALLDNRFNVAFEDINKIAPEALRHRIFLNYEALSDDIDEDYIISNIMQKH